MIDLIIKINDLWEPVYPYLVRHITEVYGRRDGRVLDAGPFAGTVFELQKKGVGDSFAIAPFLPAMMEAFRQRIAKQELDHVIRLIGTDPALAGIEDCSFDLLVFRGALFFPDLFRTDLAGIYRVLKPGGVAFVGGGFGKYTPPSVIDAIGRESRDLNLKLGKIGTTADEIWSSVRGEAPEHHMEVITEGGLWAVIRK